MLTCRNVPKNELQTLVTERRIITGTEYILRKHKRSLTFHERFTYENYKSGTR